MIRSRPLLLSLVVAGALAASMALAFGPPASQRSGPAAAQVGARGPVAGLVGGTHSDLAALLGISEDALISERASGKTVADILVEHGLTTAEASATLAQQRDARIDAMVADGTLDAVRAAQMKSRTQAAIAAMLSREPGPQAGSMAGGQRGGYAMARAPRGGARSWQQGQRGGPGMGVHQPGYRFAQPTN